MTAPPSHWRMPTLDEERSELQRTTEKLGVSPERLFATFRKATLQELDEETWSHLRNCDSREQTWTEQDVFAHIGSKRDIRRIMEAVREHVELPAPVVLAGKNQTPYLVSGNSRLLACRALHVTPRVAIIRIDEGTGS